MKLKDLRSLIDDIPKERDEDLVATYELDGGLRSIVVHVDLDCPGSIDFNFFQDGRVEE